MKVFISWSGELSRSIATELYEWLPMVVQSVQPYMSSESIDKGTRWASSIADELEGTSVGIVVLTKENRVAPWINFEAGALAKVVGDTRLAPLIFGLKPSEVGTPLSQFQVTQFDKSDILRLLKSINSCAGDESLPEPRLEKMHDALWEQLHSKVEPLLAASSKASPQAVAAKTNDASVSKALEEILTLSRQQAHFVMNPERILTPDVVRQIVDTASSSGLDERSTMMLRDYLSHAQHLWRSLSDVLVPVDSDTDEASQVQTRDRIVEFDRLLRRAVDAAHGRRRYGGIRPRVIGRPVVVTKEAAIDSNDTKD